METKLLFHNFWDKRTVRDERGDQKRVGGHTYPIQGLNQVLDIDLFAQFEYVKFLDEIFPRRYYSPEKLIHNEDRIESELKHSQPETEVEAVIAELAIRDLIDDSFSLGDEEEEIETEDWKDKTLQYRRYFNVEHIRNNLVRICTLMPGIPMKDGIFDLSAMESEPIDFTGQDTPDCWPVLSEILGKFMKTPFRRACGNMAITVLYYLWENVQEINEGCQNKIMEVRLRSTLDGETHTWAEVKFSGIEGWIVLDLTDFSKYYSPLNYYVGVQTVLTDPADPSRTFDYSNGMSIPGCNFEAVVDDFEDEVLSSI